MENTGCNGDELIYADCLMSFNSNVRPDENEKTFVAAALDEMANLQAAMSQDVVKQVATPDDAIEPEIGMEFESDDAATEFYRRYAKRVGFRFRVGRSRKSRGAVEVLIMKRFVCSKEGTYDKKRISEGARKRERTSMREGCQAMMEVVRESDRWVVSKLEKDHSHNLSASSRVGCLQATILHDASSDSTIVTPETLPCLQKNAFSGGFALGLLDYFQKRQADNPAFFYAIRVADNSSVTNVFWADSRARYAYRFFGDTVTFDTTYKQNKHMMPFVTFSGVNHHLQPVNFGCGFMADESEFSFAWLFETWLASMGGKAPCSLIADHNRAISTAVARIFPNSCHRYCKWLILSRTKQKLAYLYSQYHTLQAELEEAVIESETITTFEATWASIMKKYDLRNNSWLQGIFSMRHKWVPLYLRDTFFAEIYPKQRLETVSEYYKRHFDSMVAISVFVAQFDLDLAKQYDDEAQSDFASMLTKPTLKTASLIEKVAADVYTKSVFKKFQDEFVESLGYIIKKLEDGNTSKYCVVKDEDCLDEFYVTYNATKTAVSCSCKYFEFSGIFCRHILGVLVIVDPRVLPKEYFLKRWTRKAKDDTVPDDDYVTITLARSRESITPRYMNLCHDAIKFADRCASSELYKAAKDVLRKAYEEIIAIERVATEKCHSDFTNANGEGTVAGAINDNALLDSTRKVTSTFGQLLGASWSPM